MKTVENKNFINLNLSISDDMYKKLQREAYESNISINQLAIYIIHRALNN